MIKKRNDNKKIILFFSIISIIILFILFRIVTYGEIKNEDLINIDNSSNYYDFILKNLESGGPGKDGIPAIDKPIYVNINKTELNDNDIIYGINYNGFVAAYPKRILNWHEIVNDEINGEKISVTFCPLTGTAIGFKGKNLGVSGKLFNSNLVMYDRETNSYIPQMVGIGISHDLKGIELDRMKVETTTFKLWKQKYPQTKVLSFDTNYNRDYSRSPYGNYDSSSRIMFPVQKKDGSLFEKEIVLGILHNGDSLAIVKDSFKDKYPTGLNYTLGEEEFKFTWDDELEIITSEKEITSFESFWFAWFAYYPETKIIR